MAMLIAKSILTIIVILFSISWWSAASNQTSLKSQTLFTVASLICLGLAIHLIFGGSF